MKKGTAPAVGSFVALKARVPWLEPSIIMRLLDAGCLGVTCPMINTPADAERLVRYCKYPPRGERSFGPVRAKLLYGADYVAVYERGRCVGRVA